MAKLITQFRVKLFQHTECTKTNKKDERDAHLFRLPRFYMIVFFINKTELDRMLEMLYTTLAVAKKHLCLNGFRQFRP